ncbi:MAG: helix-turn-helix domain-containing protein [Candidatus Margulisiibacteriota bacterium]
MTEKKLSQEKLALESDMDRTYLSLLERGERNPTLKVVFALAKTLKLSPSALVKSIEQRVEAA